MPPEFDGTLSPIATLCYDHFQCVMRRPQCAGMVVLHAGMDVPHAGMDVPHAGMDVPHAGMDVPPITPMIQ